MPPLQLNGVPLGCPAPISGRIRPFGNDLRPQARQPFQPQWEVCRFELTTRRGQVDRSKASQRSEKPADLDYPSRRTVFLKPAFENYLGRLLPKRFQNADIWKQHGPLIRDLPVV